MTDRDLIIAMLQKAGIHWVASTAEEENFLIYVSPNLRFGDNKHVTIAFDPDGRLLGMAPF